MDPALILFAIEAAIKLGQKFYEVLVDANQERPLCLPLGDLFGSIPESEAIEFFDMDENGKKLVQPGGPYYDIYIPPNKPELLKAYRSVLAVNQHLGNPGYVPPGEAIELINQIHEFEQFKQGYGHADPVLRLVGEVVTIGIDYFQANPQALGKDSAARKVVAAFIPGIIKIDFEHETEEGKSQIQTIVGQVMLAGLQAFGENTNLVSKDKRIQVLLGGMTGAIVKDFQDAPTEGAADRRQDFFERATSSLLRGAMAGFADNPTLFLKGDDKSEKIIRDTITQVCKGLENQEHLFSNDSLEVILKSALVAVSDDAGLITGEKAILKKLITGTVEVLIKDDSVKKIFKNPEGTVAAILKNGLDALGENISTLIDPDRPERLFLVETIKALTAGLGFTLNTGKLKDLLSTQQLISLSQIVFNEVAQHPERLLGKGGTGPDPKMTALAQIVGSVSKALGENPKKLITGTGLLTLLQTAIRTAGQNVDKLLDLNTQDPATNLLYKVLQALTEGFSEGKGLDALFDKEMFADTACRVIVAASNNLGFVTDGKNVIPELITKLMTLTAGEEIRNLLNSGNFPIVFEGLLRQVLLDKLSLDNADAVKAAVVKILESS